MSPQKLGRRLRALRTAKKQTQDQVADAIGVSQPTVNGWEQGKSPRYEHLCKLAEHFGMRLSSLLWEDEPVQGEEKAAS